MYADTITVFNFFEDKKEDIAWWYPTVINNVEVQITKGFNASKTGNENANALYVSIPLQASNSTLFADGVKYIKPKAFKVNMSKSDTFTLAENDFIAVGDYTEFVKKFETGYIPDEYYPEGLHQHMKSTYDDVYQIKTVDVFKTIRHIEVGGI